MYSITRIASIIGLLCPMIYDVVENRSFQRHVTWRPLTAGCWLIFYTDQIHVTTIDYLKVGSLPSTYWPYVPWPCWSNSTQMFMLMMRSSSSSLPPVLIISLSTKYGGSSPRWSSLTSLPPAPNRTVAPVISATTAVYLRPKKLIKCSLISTFFAWFRLLKKGCSSNTRNARLRSALTKSLISVAAASSYCTFY